MNPRTRNPVEKKVVGAGNRYQIECDENNSDDEPDQKLETNTQGQYTDLADFKRDNSSGMGGGRPRKKPSTNTSTGDEATDLLKEYSSKLRNSKPGGYKGGRAMLYQPTQVSNMPGQLILQNHGGPSNQTCKSGLSGERVLQENFYSTNVGTLSIRTQVS